MADASTHGFAWSKTSCSLFECSSAGARFAYFLEPHVIYQVHSDNSSASATASSLAKHVEIYSELTVGIEQLLSELSLSPRERRGPAETSRARILLASRLRRLLAGRPAGWMRWTCIGGASPPGRGTRAAWKTYLLARLRVALCRRWPLIAPVSQD